MDIEDERRRGQFVVDGVAAGGLPGAREHPAVARLERVEKGGVVHGAREGIRVEDEEQQDYPASDRSRGALSNRYLRAFDHRLPIAASSSPSQG